MLSLDCLDFINGCLRYNEADRFSGKDLFEHKYITNPDLEKKIIYDYDT